MRTAYAPRDTSIPRILEGSTPPSIFIGRIGYPYVKTGISTPPLTGDTSIFDYPEKWINLRIEDIVEYRWNLVTGYKIRDVNRPEDPLLDEIRYVVLSSKPVEVSITLSKTPRSILTFSEYEPPRGPRAPLLKLRILGNPTIPRPLEKVYYDIDLPASEAVIYLYESGIPISHIQKVFSLGSLGLRDQRRLVPTRWSITAVDNIICRSIIKEIKKYPEISEIEIYEYRIHNNLFTGILIPAKWSYEWIEAWWPGSTWNPTGREVVVEGDYEDYVGRKTYPSIGGCYYASMLATLEYLKKTRRQATAILLREIYSGFKLPIGVWFVRESCREMFKKPPVFKTSDMRELCIYLDEKTRLGCGKWFKSSTLLKRISSTRRILDFKK